MTITTEPARIATARPESGCIKRYRNNPADINAALYAAAHFASRQGKDILVFAGNSYKRFGWQIKEPSAVSRVECNGGKLTGYLVKPDGGVYKIADTERKPAGKTGEKPAPLMRFNKPRNRRPLFINPFTPVLRDK